MRLVLLTLAITLPFITACSKGFQPAPPSVARDIANGIGCAETARSQIFDAYYKAHEAKADLSTESMTRGLEKLSVENKKISSAPDELREKFKASAGEIHRLMTEEVRSVRDSRVAVVRAQKPTDRPSEREDESQNEDDELLHLIRLEMRSRIDPSYATLNAKLDAAISQAKDTAQILSLECTPGSSTTPPEEEPPTEGGTAPPSSGEPTPPINVISTPVDGPTQAEPGQIPPGLPKPPSLRKSDALYGAFFTMATAYQSCETLERPLVTKQVEEVQGVIRDFKVDAVGWGRKYTDLALLKQTHYYHRGTTYGGACANQDKAPLVYDYGGKPKTSTASSTLDLFTNDGGGSALGIDCSAFVSSAVGVAGLRYKPGADNKPVYTRFTSYDFIDPVNSGWACYDSVRTSPAESIRAGDIAAVQGHVVMIDQVGSDPFGIATAKTAADCDRLSVDHFDFSVIQSSPSKQHLGINRYIASDYLAETGGKMAAMFLGYAKQACLSHFDGKTHKAATSAYGIIRHKQTAECLAPRIALRGEACVASCPQLSTQ